MVYFEKRTDPLINNSLEMKYKWLPLKETFWLKIHLTYGTQRGRMTFYQQEVP